MAQICQQDGFCCQQSWDQVCVYEVQSICKQSCPGDPNNPTCNALYGNTGGYKLCIETGLSCEFAINTTQGSCNSACTKGGGDCIGLMNDVNNQTCVKSQSAQPNPQWCNYMGWTSAICVCSRGCGGGPPCPANQTCNNGVCS